MKRKAVFAYSFSDRNAGDFSLNIAAIDILIKNGYYVSAISRFTVDAPEYISTSRYLENLFPGKVKVIGSPFKLDRSANLVVKALNYFHGFLVAGSVIKNKIIENEIADADIVVLCGGNILRCGSFIDYMRLKALFYPLTVAQKHGKEYVIYPQSTSRINRLGEGLLGKMINNAKMVFIRERLSYKKISEMYPKANVKETLDLAFFLLDERRFLPNNKSKSVAFTIRADSLGGLKPISSDEQAVISTEIIRITLELIEFCAVTFVIQGEQEDGRLTRNISRALQDKYGVEIEVIEERDTFKLIDLYASFDLLVGMRLHSIILAAVAGTPSYGFFRKEWGLKNPGIMNQIGLPFSYVDDAEDIDPALLMELMSNKRHFQTRVKKLVDAENSSLSAGLN